MVDFLCKRPRREEYFDKQEREGITEEPKFQWRQYCTESRKDWPLRAAPPPIRKMDTVSIIKGGKTTVTVVVTRVD